MTTKLQVYNQALLICGERQLSATTGLTEAVESRYLMDSVWTNGAVDLCLSKSQWTFAMRAIELGYNTGITPTFGYSHAFDIPTDFIVLSAMCSDEYFTSPLLQYAIETGYWYCDLEYIYVKYVSNDASYGGDLSNWPAAFAEHVSAYVASKIVHKLTSDEKKREEVIKYSRDTLLAAKNSDSMGEPVKFPPPGTWSSARQGRGRGDRGNRSRLIG